MHAVVLTLLGLLTLAGAIVVVDRLHAVVVLGPWRFLPAGYFVIHAAVSTAIFRVTRHSVWRYAAVHVAVVATGLTLSYLAFLGWRETVRSQTAKPSAAVTTTFRPRG